MGNEKALVQARGSDRAEELRGKRDVVEEARKTVERHKAAHAARVTDLETHRRALQDAKESFAREQSDQNAQAVFGADMRVKRAESLTVEAHANLGRATEIHSAATLQLERSQRIADLEAKLSRDAFDARAVALSKRARGCIEDLLGALGELYTETLERHKAALELASLTGSPAKPPDGVRALLRVLEMLADDGCSVQPDHLGAFMPGPASQWAPALVAQYCAVTARGQGSTAECEAFAEMLEILRESDRYDDMRHALTMARMPEYLRTPPVSPPAGTMRVIRRPRGPR